MTTARDELIDVIADLFPFTVHDEGIEAAKRRWSKLSESDKWPHRRKAQSVLAALVERYGEPEIEDQNFWDDENQTYRRLVFPWMAVKEATDV